ncbi:MAG: hypothetical protein AAFU85_11590 [Planctomycetota bacterium]
MPPRYFDSRTTEDIVNIVREHRERVIGPLRREVEELKRRLTMTHRPVHYVGRVTTKITAFNSTTKQPGTGKVMLERLNTGTDRLVDWYQQPQDVRQTGSEEITVGSRILLHVDPFGDLWVADSMAGGGNGQGRIHFTTNAAIANRQVAVTIDLIEGGEAANPADGSPLEVGDVITVNDMRNLFAEIQAGATGTAIWHEAISDDPGTPEDDSQEPHWSIEHCSLPIDEIRVYLTASLLKTDSGGTARCKVDNTASAVADGSEEEWIRSSWPRVDLPPELTEVDDEGNTYYTVDFENPHKKDAPLVISGQRRCYVILRRVTGRNPSDPTAEHSDLPKSGDINNTIRWEVVDVEEQIARIAIGTHPGGSHPVSAGGAEFVEYIDGKEATDKAPSIAWGCEPPCAMQPSCVIGRYNPEANRYVLIATTSAVMGAPQLKRLARPDLRLAQDAETGDVSLCISTAMVASWCYVEDADSCVNVYKCEDVPSS